VSSTRRRHALSDRLAQFARCRFGIAAVAAFATLPVFAQAPPPQGFPGVPPDAPPAKILSFTADRAKIAAGESVTLRWEAINAYAIELDPGLGAVATRGSKAMSPVATTTYTLSVTGPKGVSKETVTVEVSGSDGRPAAAAASATAPRSGTAASASASASDGLPRLANGKPDLSGVYLGGRDIHMAGEVMLKPGAESFRVPQNDADLGQGAKCLPPGVPNATMMPYPLQIVERDDVVVILYEAYNLFRIIPIGVPQSAPEDLDPTWMGHSVASWDGDTLVIDVAGFNDETRIAGNRHTTSMHVVERYTRTGPGTIRYEASVTDPIVFAEPVRYAGDLTAHPEWEIGEYVCAENNKDYRELLGD
jgi:hypothetical protein